MRIKLDSHGIMPTRAYDVDAGIDLYAPQDVTVYGRHSAVIPTGVHVELPQGTCGLLVSKSGLNVKRGITSTGLIDEGYTGEITVKLYNNTGAPYHIEQGDKISQLVVLPVVREPLELVDAITGGERGDNGFGSTGR